MVSLIPALGDRCRYPTGELEAEPMLSDPYKPPADIGNCRPDSANPTRDLARASTIYRWLGWIGLSYLCIAYPMGAWSSIREGSTDLKASIAATVATLFFVGLFVTMVRCSLAIRDDVASVYRKARWTGILVGAIGFPFLTAPAFYAVRLISRGYSATNNRG